MNQLGSRDEAEDAVQSTFLNAHRALQRGVTPEAELAWLFKIAHNVCLTRRRSKRRRVRVETASDLQAMQDVIPAPARESSDELIRLTDALAHMPDNQRRAILLREWQGLSYHEIADELGLSQSAVETLIFRARRSLAANLEVEPERPSLLARAKGAIDIGSLIMLAKGLFEGSAALKATAAAVAVSGAAVVATTPPKPAQEVPRAKATPAVIAPAPSARTAPSAAVDPRGSFSSSSGSAKTESPKPQPDRTSSATKRKPALVLAEPATSQRAAPEQTAPNGASFAAAPSVEAPAPAPAQPEQPAPAAKPKKDKLEPPAQEKNPNAGGPKDKGKHAEPGPVPVEVAAVIAPESTEPNPAEQVAEKQNKKDKDHGGGNGHRK